MATATKPTRATSSRLYFTISREKLIEGLAAVAPSTPAKTTLPVLGNLLLETTDRGTLRLSGTDLDIGVSIEVAADVEKGGAITVPAKRLLQIAKELPPAPVKLYSTSDNQVIVDCGRSHYKLQTLPRDEFPQFPAIDFGGPTWILEGWRPAVAGEADGLRNVGRVEPADSQRHPRPSETRSIRFVATDGHLLAHVEVKLRKGFARAGVLIIMPRVFDHVARLFGSDDQVELARTENHLGFRNEMGAMVVTRLVEGPYPNYNQVIPKKHNREATADRHSLISSVRRLSPIAFEKSHRLKLVFKQGKLELSAMTPDVGEGYDELAVKLEGDGVTIGMNASYLLDVLTRIDTDEVLLKTGNPDRAMIVRPVSDESDESAFFLIMPLRVLE
jgi:DNA polymerase-3 subunit beta